MGRQQTKCRQRLLFYVACSLILFNGLNGCAINKEVPKTTRVYQHLDREDPNRIRIYQHLDQAKALAENGDWESALSEQQNAFELSPDRPPGDRVLYEMGLLLLDSRNITRNDHQSLHVFKQLVRVFPESDYRSEAETWICVLTTLSELRARLVENEAVIKSLHTELRQKKQTIQTLRDERIKMKHIDLELNKQRELTFPGEE